MTERCKKIRQKLENAFSPEHFELVDDSLSHAGHAGTLESGHGHYIVTIVSNHFCNSSRLQRHRLIYEALGTLMQTDIHALSIKALTPAEFSGNL